VDAGGPVLRTVPQDVTERTLIREAQHIVEVARGALGITAGVRSADHGARPSHTKRLLRAYAVCAASVNTPMKTMSTLWGNSVSRSSKPV
jgi:hypothetical protein